MTGPQQDWTRIGEDRVVHPGFIRVLSRRMRLPDGREVDWELTDVPSSVSVLPFTSDGRVVMVRQYRPGPDRLVTSAPGGLLDPGETPEAAARRELLEETGYAAGSVELVATTHPNGAARPRYATVAHGCTPAGGQRLDEFEDIEVVVLDLAEVRAELRAARLGALEQTYLSLDHLGLL